MLYKCHSLKTKTNYFHRHLLYSQDGCRWSTSDANFKTGLNCQKKLCVRWWPEVVRLYREVVRWCQKGVRWCQEGVRLGQDGVMKLSDGARKVSYGVRKVSGMC